MEHKFALVDLDAAVNQLGRAVNNLSAVQDAMENGASTADGYVDALYCSIEYLSIVHKQISTCVEGLFAERRAEKGAKEAAV